MRKIYLIAAVFAALIAAAVFWSPGQTHVIAPIATSFGNCARVAEPPICLLTKAAPLNDDDARGLLGAAINAGAVQFVRDNSARLAAAAQGRGTSNSFSLHVAGQRYAAEEQLLAARKPLIAAAMALAAAAQVSDEPFAHPDVIPALTAANRSPEAAQIATTLWEDAASIDLRAKIVRPRGLVAIWRAVVAAPPTDTELLVEFARKAGYWRLEDEGVALWRAVLARKDATREERASAQLAISLPERRLLGQGPDAAWVKSVFDDCMRVVKENGYQAVHCDARLDDLAKARATPELTAIAEAYLGRARGSEENPRYKAIWFAVSSDAYRLAGDKTKALMAAREGLPFVEPALRSRWHGIPPPPMTTLEEKKRAAANSGDGAVDPVVALYRAGARDEALRTGFLTGYHRFTNAEIAGEIPDPQWVVDDRTPDVIDRLLSDLIETPRLKIALRFFNALRCDGPRFYERREMPALERALALAAALAGKRSSMLAHLARAAVAIDSVEGDDTRSFRAQLARNLAGDWRRNVTIAERVGAADDEVQAPACGAR